MVEYVPRMTSSLATPCTDNIRSSQAFQSFESMLWIGPDHVLVLSYIVQETPAECNRFNDGFRRGTPFSGNQKTFAPLSQRSSLNDRVGSLEGCSGAP